MMVCTLRRNSRLCTSLSSSDTTIGSTVPPTILRMAMIRVLANTFQTVGRASR